MLKALEWIKIITGTGCCGKAVFLLQYRQKLIKNGVVFLLFISGMGRVNFIFESKQKTSWLYAEWKKRGGMPALNTFFAPKKRKNISQLCNISNSDRIFSAWGREIFPYISTFFEVGNTFFFFIRLTFNAGAWYNYHKYGKRKKRRRAAEYGCNRKIRTDREFTFDFRSGKRWRRTPLRV